MGLPMGSPLGLVLANIFVGFYESLFLEKCCKPYVYLRYVDDTFSIFDSINDATDFHAQQFPSSILAIYFGSGV